MSDSLIKLIDRSLFPASIMVGGKLLGLMVSIWILGVEWGISDYSSTIFGARPAVELVRLREVSSLSDLFLLITLAVFTSWHLYRNIQLKSHNIHPKKLAELMERNLLRLVTHSFEVLYTGTLWLLFQWLANLTILINVATGKTYFWVWLISFIISITFTVFTLRDIYSEVEHSRRNLGQAHVF